ncbi:histidinol-phosphatase [Nocardia sp. NPDC052566]|uniref:histidinol-phosphatase n=1 Tax=Nocardia sp. NPDC052566 TaxID=3364330 RepID=UPI0037CC8AE7
MKFDLHTHHQRCGHARGSLRDYLEAALAADLDVLGCSDHSPFFGEEADHYKPWVAMARSEFHSYLSECVALREEYRGRIDLRIGVESDFFPEHVETYRRIYEGLDLDYVIGSVHVVGELDIFHPDRWIDATDEFLEGEKERYCDLVAESARSGLYDILGHIDALRGDCPRLASIETPAVDRMIEAIVEADVVVEVNTSGVTKRCGGWYPDDALLIRLRDNGIRLTFGSDAHDPHRVGDQFERVRIRLRELGYREWYVFERRQPRAIPL